MGGRSCALGSLCFFQRTSLVVPACSMQSRSLGLLERALTEVAEESSRCASNVATRCPYVLLLQGLFLRFCESQCKESKACFQVVAKMADWGRW
jgi:hypothetical protein